MQINVACSFEAREPRALYAVTALEVKSCLIASARMRAKAKKPKPDSRSGFGQTHKHCCCHRNELVNAYFYLLRLGFFFLGERQAQHAILELRIDGFRIHVWRQRE